MGVENDIFWSEIGSGFRELGHTPPPTIPRGTPPPLGFQGQVACQDFILTGPHYAGYIEIKHVCP